MVQVGCDMTLYAFMQLCRGPVWLFKITPQTPCRITQTVRKTENNTNSTDTKLSMAIKNRHIHILSYYKGCFLLTVFINSAICCKGDYSANQHPPISLVIQDQELSSKTWNNLHVPRVEGMWKILNS